MRKARSERPIFLDRSGAFGSAHPSQCSDAQIEECARLAAKGDEVDLADIKRGIQRARRLVWLYKNGAYCAVAALKNPNPTYRARVFANAGCSEIRQSYPLELGYIFVEEHAREKGIGTALVRRVLELENDELAYATTRTDNEPMQKILLAHGFEKRGSDYKSSRSDAMLSLYTQQFLTGLRAVQK